jgi:hypothetical protein
MLTETSTGSLIYQLYLEVDSMLKLLDVAGQHALRMQLSHLPELKSIPVFIKSEAGDIEPCLITAKNKTEYCLLVGERTCGSGILINKNGNILTSQRVVMPWLFPLSLETRDIPVAINEKGTAMWCVSNSKNDAFLSRMLWKPLESHFLNGETCEPANLSITTNYQDLVFHADSKRHQGYIIHESIQSELVLLKARSTRSEVPLKGCFIGDKYLNEKLIVIGFTQFNDRVSERNVFINPQIPKLPGATSINAIMHTKDDQYYLDTKLDKNITDRSLRLLDGASVFNNKGQLIALANERANSNDPLLQYSARILDSKSEITKNIYK